MSVWKESPAWDILCLDSGGEAEVRFGCSKREPIVGLGRSCLMPVSLLSLMMRRQRVCVTRTGGLSAGVRSLGVVTVRLGMRTAVFYL